MYAVQPILGGVLLICGLGSAGTAISRWVIAYRELAKRGLDPVEIEPVPAQQPAVVPVFPVPAKLRESSELAPAVPRTV
jgi:hypothetical protein